MVEPSKRVIDKCSRALRAGDYVGYHTYTRKREVTHLIFGSSPYPLSKPERPPVESSLASTCPTFVDPQVLVNPMYGLRTNVSLLFARFGGLASDDSLRFNVAQHRADSFPPRHSAV